MTSISATTGYTSYSTTTTAPSANAGATGGSASSVTTTSSQSASATNITLSEAAKAALAAPDFASVIASARAALAARREVPGLPVLILSQHVEQLYARELLADGTGAIGYLLKDRVFNAEQFIDAVRRVAAGGTVMDPEVIAKLVAGNASDPLAALTPREREVLSLMAEGCSNAAIASRLHFSEGAVGKHTANIFAKLDITASDDTNRRVLAVLTYLGAGT